MKCDRFAFHLELQVADFLLQVEIVGGQVGEASVGLVQLAAQLGDLVLLDGQRRPLALRQLQPVEQSVLQQTSPSASRQRTCSWPATISTVAEARPGYTGTPMVACLPSQLYR